MFFSCVDTLQAGLDPGHWLGVRRLRAELISACHDGDMIELPSAPADREARLRRYRQLVDVELPAAARSGGWILRENHCFGRVLLDHAVGRCWYEVLDRRAGAAYRQLDDDTLAETVGLAERLLVEGDPLLQQLDERSLRWRGKRPKTGRRA